MRIYDVTVPITETMPVWPGDPSVRVEQVSSLKRGDSANVSRLSLSCHTGTHVDAPFHFLQQGATVDRLPLDALMGPAFIADLSALEGNTIEVFDLAALHFPRDVSRLLLKTRNSYFWEDKLTEFERDFVHLSPQAAQWLVRRGIRLVGIDYLSIEVFGASRHRVHKTLLAANVVIVEGLDLSRVPEGRCQLVCLPLRIEGADGAPARALVIRP